MKRDFFDKEMDRRTFLEKTTKLAGVTLGLSLLSPLTGIPAAKAASEAPSHKFGEMSFQFGLVADAQYADVDPKGTRYYRASLEKLAEAVDTFNKNDLAFAVHLGDFIDRDAASFSKILPVFNQVNVPKYHLLGNHDFAMEGEKVARLLGMPGLYYDFGYQGWRFIVLDTNDISTYAYPVGSEKYNEARNIYEVLKWSGVDNAQTWNGGVGSEQMVWLQNVLAKSVLAGEKVIVMGHMPLAPENMHNTWNDDALIKAFESAGNVVAYFNGHNHAGNYAEKNGIHYLNFKGMVETADTNAYSIVRVYPEGLVIKGYGREPDRVLMIGKKTNAKEDSIA
ncbi:metallophosphoesterase [Paenibacillus alkalitolerans]|uniref:metallophosphoesterase n=1 Tax=Paenibacillus alkalitolerans TaxID=2799335 RepID=UPI0018F39948|nr:metallophosphoesterase [Paenibacillus alkalitolerans]